jgi:branched-chain amino acid transport system permease protein
MTAFELFIQQMINGLTVGSVIALIALGYTMVYGIVELINFAHGDLYMLGAFLCLTLVSVLGLTAQTQPAVLVLSLLTILVACSIFTAVLNVLIERFAYRPLRGAPRLAPLVSAIGVSFILENMGLMWGGLPMVVMGANAAAPKTFPDLLPRVNILNSIGLHTGIQLNLKDFLVVAVTFPLMILLYLFIKFTKLGKAMRATAESPVAARIVGIDVNKVISVTFLIGGALAGAASLITCLAINRVEFRMGYMVGLKAFTAAVLGGIGNIPGAVLGGLMMGILSAMSDQYLKAEWTNAVVFGILILVLVFRPSGLLGATSKEKV